MDPAEVINELTRQEWRKLGFYYERSQSYWLFIGSRAGLQGFCKLLREYVLNPEKVEVGSHAHYGPYVYLQVITWEKPYIADHGIFGRLSDLEVLAVLIEKKLNETSSGNSFAIDREYSEENHLTLKFELREDGFDPSHADPSLN